MINTDGNEVWWLLHILFRLYCHWSNWSNTCPLSPPTDLIPHTRPFSPFVQRQRVVYQHRRLYSVKLYSEFSPRHSARQQQLSITVEYVQISVSIYVFCQNMKQLRGELLPSRTHTHTRRHESFSGWAGPLNRESMIFHITINPD